MIHVSGLNLMETKQATSTLIYELISRIRKAAYLGFDFESTRDFTKSRYDFMDMIPYIIGIIQAYRSFDCQ